MSLQGRVAIVTGGNSGIGQAIVLELARLGANVVIDYVAHPEATEALEQQVAKLGEQSIGVEPDASKLADLQMLIDRAVTTFGRVDIMVNNAGVETRSSILDTTEEQYDRVMAIHLKSAFFGTQIAAKQMIKQSCGGRVINVSSVHEDWPMPGNTPYCQRRHAHADPNSRGRARQTQHPRRRGGSRRRGNTDQSRDDERSKEARAARCGDTTAAHGATGGDCQRRRLCRRRGRQLSHGHYDLRDGGIMQNSVGL